MENSILNKAASSNTHPKGMLDKHLKSILWVGMILQSIEKLHFIRKITKTKCNYFNNIKLSGYDPLRENYNHSIYIYFIYICVCLKE